MFKKIIAHRKSRQCGNNDGRGRGKDLMGEERAKKGGYIPVILRESPDLRIAFQVCWEDLTLISKPSEEPLPKKCPLSSLEG